MKKLLKAPIFIILALGTVALASIISSWLLVWALNTLFPTLAIKFTFQVYCAATVILGFFGGWRQK